MDTDWDAPLLVYLPMNGHIPGLSHPVASVWCLYLKLRIPASEYKLQLYLGGGGYTMHGGHCYQCKSIIKTWLAPMRFSPTPPACRASNMT